MTTELSTQSAADVLAVLQGNVNEKATDKALAAVTKVGDWLPYMQLYGGNSKACKRGEIGMGHFGVTVNKQRIDLGKSFIALIASWRPKAMQYSPEVISFYDSESPGFKDIESTADLPNSGKGYGPEFLFWLPEQNMFATYFFGNKTGRMEAPNLIGEFKQATKEGRIAKCKVESHFIETKKFSWHGPEKKAYDLPIEPMPAAADLLEVIQKFNNPPKSQVEPAERAEERG